MGQRHLCAANQIKFLKKIFLHDPFINRNSILLDKKSEFINDLNEIKKQQLDLVIISTNPDVRLSIIKKLNLIKVSSLLIEKPVSLNSKEYFQLDKVLKLYNVQTYVNLSKRCQPWFIELKHKLLESINEERISISINTGAIGIITNGIHYIDLIYSILKSSDFKIEYKKVFEETIVSPRGVEYSDRGGKIVLLFKKNNWLIDFNFVINPRSSVFGDINVISEKNHFIISEMNKTFSTQKKNANSKLPVYFYSKDFGIVKSNELKTKSLEIISKESICKILKNKSIDLPTLEDCKLSHQILFKWLDKTK